MRTIHRQRRKLDLPAYRLRSARESDFDELLTEDFMLFEDGRLQVVYLNLAGDAESAPIYAEMERALRALKYRAHYRTNALLQTTQTFGYRPRVPIRNDWCGSTVLSRQRPAEHAAIVDGVRIVARFYQALNPDLYARHAAMTQEKVLPDYRLDEGAFTSGIVNKNNPLHYHFDAGNYPGVWSGMLGFKRRIAGGYLALPQFGIAAEIADRSLFLFDGQGILHGVTPIRKLDPAAERYTVVYYSLRGMWQCLPPEDEARRIQKLRTEREERRLSERLAKP